jgi:hypothetical protein
VIGIHSDLVASKVDIGDEGIGGTGQVGDGIVHSDRVHRVQVDDVSGGRRLARGYVQRDVLGSGAMDEIDLGNAGDISSNHFTNNDSTGGVDGIVRGEDRTPDGVLDVQGASRSNKVVDDGSWVGGEVVSTDGDIAGADNVEDPFGLEVAVLGPVVRGLGKVSRIDVNGVSEIGESVASDVDSSILDVIDSVGGSSSQIRRELAVASVGVFKGGSQTSRVLAFSSGNGSKSLQISGGRELSTDKDEFLFARIRTSRAIGMNRSISEDGVSSNDDAIIQRVLVDGGLEL